MAEAKTIRLRHIRLVQNKEKGMIAKPTKPNPTPMRRGNSPRLIPI
jgi:hypothetical protein